MSCGREWAGFVTMSYVPAPPMSPGTIVYWVVKPVSPASKLPLTMKSADAGKATSSRTRHEIAVFINRSPFEVDQLCQNRDEHSTAGLFFGHQSYPTLQ